MATITQISDSLSLARAYYSKLLSEFISNLKAGIDNHTIGDIKCLRRLIRALEWDVEIEHVDDTTVILYGMLLKAIAPYTGSTLPVNPNVYIPGVVIGIGGESSLSIIRSQATLLETFLGSGIWYLPMIDGSGNAIAATSVYVIYNGLSLPGAQLDTTVSPNRVYGIFDNSAATILVTYTS